MGLGGGIAAEAEWEARGEALVDLCERFGGCLAIVFARSKAKVNFLAKGLDADAQGAAT